jgi:hypothetical protein
MLPNSHTYSNLAGDWAEKKQEHHVTSRIGRSSAAAKFRPSLQVRKNIYIFE